MNGLTSVFALTFVASIVLTWIVRRAAVRFGAIDRPDGCRKRHAVPTPRWGGIAVYLAMVLGIGVAGQGRFGIDEHYTELALLLIIAAGIVCFCGAIDDRHSLSSRAKLVLQFVAVMPLIVFGYSIEKITILGFPLYLGWFGVPLTVFWLLACINSLNLLDGMDGLASLVGVLTAAMIAIVAHSLGHEHVSVMGVVLTAAAAGFLVHNRPPARIFLGDSGSMVLGLTLGVLGLQGALKTSTTLAIAIPAVIMSLPLFDTLLAVVRRKLNGRSLAAADREHIHHRLLDRGMTPWQVLCLLGALCLLTGGAATAATIFRNESVAWITALTLLVLVIRLRLFGHHEFALVQRRLAELGRALLAQIVRVWTSALDSILPHNRTTIAAPATPSNRSTAIPDVRHTQAAALLARRDRPEEQASPTIACPEQLSSPIRPYRRNFPETSFDRLVERAVASGVVRIECTIDTSQARTRLCWSHPKGSASETLQTWTLLFEGGESARCQIEISSPSSVPHTIEQMRLVGAAAGSFLFEALADQPPLLALPETVETPATHQKAA